jgi:hypothetical protein
MKFHKFNDNHDDEVVIKVTPDGQHSVWGLRRDWDRLMKLGEESGMDHDTILSMYDATKHTNNCLRRPTDFETLLQDTRLSVILHLEVLNVVGMISDEFGLDSKDVYTIYNMLLNRTDDDRPEFERKNPLPSVQYIGKLTYDYVNDNIDRIRMKYKISNVK